MPVFDRGELPDGRPYFTMELLYTPWTLQDIVERRDAGTLARYTTLKPLMEIERLVQDVLIPVADGIYVANVENGVVHRDLKPGNVLVDSRTLRPVRDRLRHLPCARAQGGLRVEDRAAPHRRRRRHRRHPALPRARAGTRHHPRAHRRVGHRRAAALRGERRAPPSRRRPTSAVPSSSAASPRSRRPRPRLWPRATTARSSSATRSCRA